MVKQNMCLKMTLLCSFIITFSTKIDSCCDLWSFCLTRDPIRQPDSQPEQEPESELEQLTLAEVVINLDDPGTMDLGPLADIPVIIVDNAVGLTPLSTIVPAKKEKEMWEYYCKCQKKSGITE